MLWDVFEIIGKLLLVLIVAAVVYAIGFGTGFAHGECSVKDSVAIRDSNGKFICVKGVK
jgi:hypothetical protein